MKILKYTEDNLKKKPVYELIHIILKLQSELKVTESHLNSCRKHKDELEKKLFNINRRIIDYRRMK